MKSQHAKRETGAANSAKKNVQVVGTCSCGCGGEICQHVPFFLPGHDAKVHAMIKQIKAGELAPSKLPKVAADYIARRHPRLRLAATKRAA